VGCWGDGKHGRKTAPSQPDREAHLLALMCPFSDLETSKVFETFSDDRIECGRQVIGVVVV
jgi:hypothetical protein